ncbi:glutathione S-transferase [Salinisphaera sp. T31B1]|uniref:glutathione S-transferase n=1 Tax=Salinisphaera sp. T31B1 TaxID=727963 RepID=UPI00333E96C5
MITVHHLEDSRSQRVLWLLEELGLEYEIRHYRRDPKTMLAPDALRQVHPLGKSPVITDDQRTVAETGLIVDYIVERHGGGRLAPERGSDERLQYDYWLHYAEGSAMPPLLLHLVFDTVEKKSPFLIKPIAKAISANVKKQFIRPQLDLHLDFMENELRQHEWFVGNQFSAADIMMSFPLEAAASRRGLESRCPRIKAFLERIHQRPAYQRALEKGGPYAYA